MFPEDTYVFPGHNICIFLRLTYVSGTHICVSETHICVSETHIYVSETHINVSETNTYVSGTNTYVSGPNTYMFAGHNSGSRRPFDTLTNALDVIFRA